MAEWKTKKSYEKLEIDFETIEELFEELLGVFEEQEIDFTKTLKLGFDVSLRDDGSLSIEKFGLLKERKQQKEEVPLVDMIEFEKELMVVVETNSLPLSDVDVKVKDSQITMTNQKTGELMKKINFPCKVRENTLKTKFNNGVLEMRLLKKIAVKKSL